MRRWQPIIVALAVSGCGADTASAPGASGPDASIEDFWASAADIPAPPDDVVASADAPTPAHDLLDAEAPEDTPLVDAETPLVALPDGLVGEAVDPPLPLATFAHVVDEDGEPVNPEDLRGRWTVIWFYPAANTFG